MFALFKQHSIRQNTLGEQSSRKGNVEAVTWCKTVKNISLYLRSIEVTVIICCKYFLINR